MLLVWQGSKPGRRWLINRKRVGVAGLQKALNDYWAEISNHFLNVVAVEVVVIDLTLRAGKSDQ